MPGGIGIYIGSIACLDIILHYDFRQIYLIF